MFMTNNSSMQEVLFFPQMRPEIKKTTIELSEEEKIILAFFKNKDKLKLSELKTQSGLSNKKWDKAIKKLTKNNLTKIKKTDNDLFVFRI